MKYGDISNDSKIVLNYILEKQKITENKIQYLMEKNKNKPIKLDNNTLNIENSGKIKDNNSKDNNINNNLNIVHSSSDKIIDNRSQSKDNNINNNPVLNVPKVIEYEPDCPLKLENVNTCTFASEKARPMIFQMNGGFMYG